ncbi:hypothetical protein FIBSPDRAFT_814412 [Athelia psychrophila]|uniref:DUF6533 domain-containing protein n=1 Tax=Athelia psychrophila TaxID=1759441 RepID=A0A166TWV9_9AGAM|nr:hypothetical protein FIBSPDRAFT_814412 [Fibularhizoctonia sp. CBS 109695]
MAASPTLQIFLPPVDPLAYKVMTYVAVVQLTAYSYDWLLSIPGEQKVISRAGLNWSITVYLLSRITTFLHLGLIAIFVFAPVGNCTALVAVLSTCAVIKVLATSSLFFMRVRAVYLGSIFITVLFGILWLIMATLNTFTDVLIRPATPTSPHNCLSYQIRYATYPIISSFAFDTCVFGAISYRLAANAATAPNWRARLQPVLTGKGLFRLSRSLMISGQLYYLAIIIFFWVNLIVSDSPLIPATSHDVLTTAYVTFTNIMACRVFRGVALGMLETSPTSSGLSTTQIAGAFELAPVPTSRGDPSKLP